MSDENGSPKSESDQPASRKAAIRVVGVSTTEEGSDGPDAKALKSLFKIALETRNFEIAQLVQRNNFFMIFQGVLFAGLVQSSHEKPVVSFLVCMAGLVVSLFQVQMAAGAKFWQEYWEAALRKIEEILLMHLGRENKRNNILSLFHGDDLVYEKMVREKLRNETCNLANRLIMQRYSVSRVPIHVACALGLIWLLLTLCTVQSYPPLSIPSFIVGFGNGS